MRRYAAAYIGVLAYIFGGMFFASLLEERITPWSLWEGQYRAFFPGDLGLALALVAGFALAQRLKPHVPRWWKLLSVGLGLGLGVWLFVYQITEEEVQRGVQFAPTRIWHQIFVWGGLSAVALWFIIPALVRVIRLRSREAAIPIALIVLGLTVWWVCGVWDSFRGNFLDPNHPMHAPWKPLFQAWWKVLFG